MHRTVTHAVLGAALQLFGIHEQVESVAAQSRLKPFSSEELRNYASEFLRIAKRNRARLCLKHHPDKGGTHEKMAEINAAFSVVEAFLSAPPIVAEPATIIRMHVRVVHYGNPNARGSTAWA